MPKVTKRPIKAPLKPPTVLSVHVCELRYELTFIPSYVYTKATQTQTKMAIAVMI